MREKAWVISVNMGYGHQRTAYSLRNLGQIINANDYDGIPKRDKKIWEIARRGYEFISNCYRIPLIGKAAFSLFDRFQRILTFYPKRDLSRPNFQLKQVYSLMKNGWGRHLIENLKFKNPNLPIISTFFIPAFMAEYFDYPGEIFCVVCDADISRTWASLNSRGSKIKYFAPTERVVERLELYGINKENIFLTGYPLPLENIGTKKMEILKEDLKYRLLNLDPEKKYFEKYKKLIEEKLGKLPEKSDHPLTILFSVGGTGVQKEIGIKIIKSLVSKIKAGEVKIILSAGIREKVKEYFEKKLKEIFSDRSTYRYIRLLENWVEIIFEKDINDYFQKFNFALKKTDILWTKPSELSFYSALGIPVIIALPIGSQEEFNMRYLLKSGFGLFQENPNHTREWFFDWLKKGYLAEAAMEGFIEGEKLGTLNIQKICFG